jgi:hypothetical protein
MGASALIQHKGNKARLAGIAGIVIGLIFMLIAPFAKNQLQCQDCHKAWKYPVADNPFKTHQNQPE